MARKTVRFKSALAQAISQWDHEAKDKLRLRLAIAMRPEIRDAIEAFIAEVAAEEDPVAFADVRAGIDLDQLEKFLQLLIKYLPAILEIILPLFLG